MGEDVKKKGIDPPAPIIIGDMEKAKSVYDAAKNYNYKISEALWTIKNACLAVKGH